MRIGFTGTRSIAGREDEIAAWLDTLAMPGSEFTTGACVGFDAFVARYLLSRFPNATHRLVVPANRSQIDPNLLIVFMAQTVPGKHIVEYMEDGTTYKQRNQRILHHSDHLVALSDYPEKHGRSTRSGTWQTVRLARSLYLYENEIDLKILNPGTEDQ